MRFARNVGSMIGMSVATLPQRRKIPRDSFALRLVSLRHDLDLSQEQIADLCGVKRPTWATWENGALPRNQAAVVQDIAKATGYDRDWLLYGLETGSPDPNGGLPRQDSNLEPAGPKSNLRIIYPAVVPFERIKVPA